jgi:DNA-binding transcriptional regulator YdaS (Cro superfamily)
MEEITKEAIRRAGGATKLASLLPVTPQAVSQWSRVPPEHVLIVEQASGVSRHQLRPDIFGEATA